MRVWGLGIKVRGLGPFRVEGLGVYRVSGIIGFRCLEVQGLGIGVSGYRVQAIRDSELEGFSAWRFGYMSYTLNPKP